MASSWSLYSFASPPLLLPSRGEPRTRESDGFSRVLRCALGSRTRKAGASSSSPFIIISSTAAGRAAVKAAPPPKKRHWKEGEFPGVSEAAVSKPPRTPIKNVKKKVNDRVRKAGASSSSPSITTSSVAAGRAAVKAVPPPKKRHWKEGEFPGVSEAAVSKPPRTPIKNVKKKVDDRAAAKAWVSTVTEALADKIQKKQWQEALEVFEMLKEQPFYYPKEGTYMKLLILLGKSGQAYQAQELFDNMVEEGLQPTSELYTALLAAYCRSNLLDEAFSVLNKMKTLPLCQPDAYTYSTLIKACVEASRFELVDSLYQDMCDRSITPNTVTQNIVLSGYGKAGKFNEMEKVLSGMLESTACKPDIWTMNIILSLFGNRGEVDLMEKWYERFRGFGIEPETRTFNILIGAYGKRRMYDKMTSVMEYMRRLAFPWTTSTYNNVIEAFADVGDAKNMDHAFNQMRAEGMKADTKTFCCLIKGFSNAGLFHKVVGSIQLAERLEIPTNTSFYNAVISACAKAGDLMEMERVFKRMKDRHYTPDSTTYSILVDAYRKEGMTDKIYDLEQENPKMFGVDLLAK